MKIIKCSAVVFLNRDFLLLEDRRHKSKHGEKYTFFGGSIEQGENPLQAAKREINEELGILDVALAYHGDFTFNPTADLTLLYHVYIADIPCIDNFELGENIKYTLFRIEDIDNIDLLKQDTEILDSVLAIKK